MKKIISTLNLILLLITVNTGLLNAQIGKNRQQIFSEYEITDVIKEEKKGDVKQLHVNISEGGGFYYYIFSLQNDIVVGVGVVKLNALTRKNDQLPISKAVELMRRNSKKWMIFSQQKLQLDVVMFVSPDEGQPELYATYLDHKCLNINTKKYAETFMGSAAVER